MRKMLLFDEIQFFLSVIRSAVALLYLFLFFLLTVLLPFYLEANNEKVMNKFPVIFGISIDGREGWRGEETEKRMRVNYNSRNHRYWNSSNMAFESYQLCGNCVDFRGIVQACGTCRDRRVGRQTSQKLLKFPKPCKALRNLQSSSPGRDLTSHNFPRPVWDAENPITLFAKRRHETLTSEANHFVRKIPNRLIKSGKHNLLYNIHHSCPFLSARFLRNHKSECWWSGGKSLTIASRENHWTVLIVTESSRFMNIWLIAFILWGSGVNFFPAQSALSLHASIKHFSFFFFHFSSRVWNCL